MFNVRFHYTWLVENEGVKSGEMLLFGLLDGIHREGSLRAAAKHIGLSYRYAWGLLGRWGEQFGQPLAVLEQGRGAKLTPLGEKLLWAQQRVQARLAPQIESLSTELERELATVMDAGAARLEMSASHDLALSLFRDHLAKHQGPRLDIRFQGSADCLAALAANQIEIAGFHFSAQGGAELALFRQWLKPKTMALIRFVIRVQGLIVAKGNPKKLHALADLARTRARFVNRQPGSGTRLAFDRLLEEAGIESKRILGYEQEEFTHLAVAATVASGHADAGIGIEAAAHQYQLDFVPLFDEQYYFACRRDLLAQARMQALLEALRKPALRNAIRKLAGYGVDSLGEICDIDAAFPKPCKP
jgi:putative molybdopterin biosynthesis protein